MQFETAVSHRTLVRHFQTVHLWPKSNREYKLSDQSKISMQGSVSSHSSVSINVIYFFYKLFEQSYNFCISNVPNNISQSDSSEWRGRSIVYLEILRAPIEQNLPYLFQFSLRHFQKKAKHYNSRLSSYRIFKLACCTDVYLSYSLQ